MTSTYGAIGGTYGAIGGTYGALSPTTPVPADTGGSSSSGRPSEYILGGPRHKPQPRPAKPPSRQRRVHVAVLSVAPRHTYRQKAQAETKTAVTAVTTYRALTRCRRSHNSTPRAAYRTVNTAESRAERIRIDDEELLAVAALLLP